VLKQPAEPGLHRRQVQLRGDHQRRRSQPGQHPLDPPAGLRDQFEQHQRDRHRAQRDERKQPPAFLDELGVVLVLVRPLTAAGRRAADVEAEGSHGCLQLVLADAPRVVLDDHVPVRQGGPHGADARLRFQRPLDDPGAQ
jgi:hypothetical protein